MEEGLLLDEKPNEMPNEPAEVPKQLNKEEFNPIGSNIVR